MLSVTKIFSFEAAHALSVYKGPCKNIHGHSYKLHVTVTGPKNPLDMIMDFKDLKKTVQSCVLDDLDHALLLKKNDINTSATHNLVSKLFWMDREPTAESMVELIASRIRNALPADIELVRIRLYETETCYAEIS